MDELTQVRHDLAAMQEKYTVDISRLERALTEEVSEHRVAEEHELLGEASFGTFDGMTSVVGIVVALISRPTAAIVTAAVGLAVAAAVGMAAGDYLGDREPGALKRAGVMGAATVFGTLVPIIPFFVFTSKHTALIVGAAITFCVATTIGFVRREGAKGFLVTYAILVAAIGATIGVSLLIPGSAGG